MHSPWLSANHGYERQFRRQVPQWVHTLDREDATKLLNLCNRLGWRLPSKVLIQGAQHYGEDSIWANQYSHWWDAVAEPKDPLDLQNLPFDPAEEAIKASLSMTTKKENPDG